MTYNKSMTKEMNVKYAVVERNVYRRGESRIVETFSDERSAWNRVRRLTVEKGGGGWYYTVEVQ
jgi:hypothetical protein